MKRLPPTKAGDDGQVRWSHAGAHEEDEIIVPSLAEVGDLRKHKSINIRHLDLFQISHH